MAIVHEPQLLAANKLKSRAALERRLESQGVRYLGGGSQPVWTTEAAIDAALGLVVSTNPPSTPPMVSLLVNIEQYAVSLPQIIEQARPYSRTNLAYCGLYFLLLKDELRYIGISNCIATRLAQHQADPFKTFDRVFSLEAPELVMRELEDLYIWWFDPPDNVRRWPVNPDLRDAFMDLPEGARTKDLAL